MTHHSPVLEQLEQLIDRQLVLIDCLLKVQDAEKTCLLGSTGISDKNRISRKKLLRQYDVLSNKQCDILAQHGFSPDTAGMETCLQTCHKKSSLPGKWKQYRLKLARFLESTIRLNALADAQNKRSAQLLTLLLGQKIAPVSRTNK